MHESLSVVDLENSVQIHGEGNSLEELPEGHGESGWSETEEHE